eukprot:1150118-Pelagomonas_calceolata.AAC.1
MAACIRKGCSATAIANKGKNFRWCLYDKAAANKHQEFARTNRLHQKKERATYVCPSKCTRSAKKQESRHSQQHLSQTTQGPSVNQQNGAPSIPHTHPQHPEQLKYTEQYPES